MQTSHVPGWWDRATSWRRPSTLTAIAKLRPDAARGVGERLAGMGRSVENVPQLSGRELSNTHFFRLLVTEDHLAPRADLPPHLLLSTVFDGSLDEHLRDLKSVMGQGLAELFANCVDYSPGTDVGEYIKEHVVAHDLFYIGAVRGTLQEIREEAQLVAALGDFADGQLRVGAWGKSSVQQIHRDCLGFVRAHPELAQQRRARRPFLSRVVQICALLGRAALMLGPVAAISAAIPWGRQSPLHLGVLGLLLVIGAAGVALLAIRILELVEPDDVPTSQPDTSAVEAQEDFQVQNQFTMLTPIRGSWIRRTAIRFMLWWGNALSEHLWNRGKLVGVGTIHFARMFRLFSGRYMLFMSDYDGSWRRYLGDFLTVGAFAVVPIWAHLRGCPKTRFLYWTTPGFGERFLRFTRTYQVPSQLWYSAYKDLTMANILRAARIREGLFSARSNQGIQDWLWEL